MGGEITWDCLSSGKFVFRVKLYRECQSTVVPGLTLTVSVTNHPTVNSMQLERKSRMDISPTCNANYTGISCTNPQAGAVEEHVYESQPITLAGTPPDQGWIFTYQNCCRNPIDNLDLVPNTTGFTLRAVMYAFEGRDMSTCYDSSPKFLESPKTIICIGNPFTYNHNAVDAELDSLSYSWAEPLKDYTGVFNPPSNPGAIPFKPGFSYDSPLPGTSLDPRNVPAVMNPYTGEISYTSYTAGNFITAIKISGYKCGELVAEVYRELQVVLLGTCGSNAPPAITAPFQDANGQFTQFADTVMAGTLVTFSLTSTDNGTLPDGSPQQITLEATGIPFGANYTSTTTGCADPPCATLTPPPPASAQGSLTTNFSWQTNCNHISYNTNCNTSSNTYTLVFKAQDDFCPAPAIKVITVSITVLARPVMNSPVLHCLQVEPNGNATLTWTKPVDLGTFNSYHIYSSTDPNGPFSVVDSIFDYNQTTYTDDGAGAHLGPVYYYIRSRSGCNGLAFGGIIDTLSTIHLAVSNPGNGTASLSWNAMSNPKIPSASGVYRIYKEFPAGSWSLLHTTQATSYIDTISMCNAFINYRIEMDDASGCTSVSNIQGGNFQDIIPPPAPPIDSVSVDPVTGNAVIGWSPSSSQDAVAYIVYQRIGGINVTIDTVHGYTNTVYVNSASAAGTGTETYMLAAYDSCGNRIPFGDPVRSIFATVNLDICVPHHEIRWNSYINMRGGLGGYRILASVNGAPYSVVGTTTDTVFIHTGLQERVTYCYLVQAFNQSATITASSNIICSFTNVPKEPQFSYLRSASVTDETTVKITALVDTAAAVKHYKVLRTESLSEPFSQVGTIPTTGSPIITGTDNTAKTSTTSYYYKLVAVDTCGKDRLETNIGRTILLVARGNDVMTNTLTWNDYEEWYGNVRSYNVYRGVDGVFDPVPVTNLPFIGGENLFVDDISPVNYGAGIFSYYVEALEGSGNPFAFADTSRSNVTKAYQDPKVYIPNAFIPTGVTTTFKPVGLYISKEDYSFMIFNRFGQMIFQTSDPNEGWTGATKNGSAEGGVYIYLIRYKSADGELTERKGSVTLIR